MRKIEKNLELATSYKNWLDELNKEGKDHPEYSSKHKFYHDVVANLLWVQGGLCAYTEMFWVNKEHVKPSKWENGRFKDFDFLGHLDHYNSSLKKQKGWEWTNFFAVHSDVNVKRKGQKAVQGILKPDEVTYDPFYYLEYDFKAHHFLPNRERPFPEQQNIRQDINTLGLNYQPVIDHRRKYLTPIIDDVSISILTLEQARERLYQFYTAFEMSIRSLELA